MNILKFTFLLFITTTHFLLPIDQTYAEKSARQKTFRYKEINTDSLYIKVGKFKRNGIYQLLIKTKNPKNFNFVIADEQFPIIERKFLYSNTIPSCKEGNKTRYTFDFRNEEGAGLYIKNTDKETIQLKIYPELTKNKTVDNLYLIPYLSWSKTICITLKLLFCFPCSLSILASGDKEL